MPEKKITDTKRLEIFFFLITYTKIEKRIISISKQTFLFLFETCFREVNYFKTRIFHKCQNRISKLMFGTNFLKCYRITVLLLCMYYFLPVWPFQTLNYLYNCQPKYFNKTNIFFSFFIFIFSYRTYLCKPSSWRFWFLIQKLCWRKFQNITKKIETEHDK